MMPCRAATAMLSTALLLLLALASGCTERDAMPTLPVETGDASPGIWTKVYPTLPTEGLSAIWGMDADDMWAVGGEGTIVHFDGERLHLVASPTTQTLYAIDGCSATDIYAAGSGVVVHWNGHVWSDITPDVPVWVRSLVCRSSTEVFVASQVNPDSMTINQILRYDGARWRDTGFPIIHASAAARLWDPDPAGSLVFSQVDGGSYAYDGQSWEPLDSSFYVVDSDGDLVMARRGVGSDRVLFRVGGDGSLEELCDDFDPGFPSLIAASRTVVASNRNEIWTSTPCHRQPTSFTTESSVYDLAVPERPGSSGPAVFAVGNEALFTRGAWQADGTLIWRDLWDGRNTDLDPYELAGDGATVYATTARDRLVTVVAGQVSIDQAGPNVRYIRTLPGGDIVALQGNRRLVRRRASGAWEMIGPEISVPLHEFWTDGADRALLTHIRACWTLDAGAWAEADSLPAPCDWIDGYAIDDLYARGAGKLMHFDGQTWSTVLGDSTLYVGSAYCSRQGHRVYLGVSHGYPTYGVGYYEDGAFVEDDPDVGFAPSRNFCEVAPGEFYCLGVLIPSFANVLYHRTPSGIWDRVEVVSVFSDFNRIYAHAGLGIVAVGYDGLFRRDLPTGAP